MREAVVDFVASPSAAADARHFASATAREWGLADLVDTIELLVSELVTNAVCHAGSHGELRLAELDDGVHVGVTDASTDSPAVPLVDPTVASGRGLLLVRELSDAWGIDRRDDGKVVWFELTS